MHVNSLKTIAGEVALMFKPKEAKLLIARMKNEYYYHDI